MFLKIIIVCYTSAHKSVIFDCEVQSVAVVVLLEVDAVVEHLEELVVHVVNDLLVVVVHAKHDVEVVSLLNLKHQEITRDVRLRCVAHVDTHDVIFKRDNKVDRARKVLDVVDDGDGHCIF